MKSENSEIKSMEKVMKHAMRENSETCIKRLGWRLGCRNVKKIFNKNSETKTIKQNGFAKETTEHKYSHTPFTLQAGWADFDKIRERL